jgi:hypothetical protein
LNVPCRSPQARPRHALHGPLTRSESCVGERGKSSSPSILEFPASSWPVWRCLLSPFAGLLRGVEPHDADRTGSHDDRRRLEGSEQVRPASTSPCELILAGLKEGEMGISRTVGRVMFRALESDTSRSIIPYPIVADWRLSVVLLERGGREPG